MGGLTNFVEASEAVGVAVVRAVMRPLVLCDVEYGAVVELTIACVNCQFDVLCVLRLVQNLQYRRREERASYCLLYNSASRHVGASHVSFHVPVAMSEYLIEAAGTMLLVLSSDTQAMLVLSYPVIALRNMGILMMYNVASHT